MELIEVCGTYREVGYQIGQMFQDKIKTMIIDRYDTLNKEILNSGLTFKMTQLKKITVKLASSLKHYTPNEYEELCGVSNGANVELLDVIFVLGYSDIFDTIFKTASIVQISDCGCTSFLTSGLYNKNVKTYAGQTWDMPPGTEKYTALFHKKINDGTEFYSYSTILGLTHFGINSNGICIGTTNVSTTETGSGVIFCALIQSALAQNNIEKSVNIIKSLPKVSGHYYYLVAPNNIAYAIEVSALDCHITTVKDDIYVHANHYKSDIFLKHAINYSPSSIDRENYVVNFFNDKCGNLEVKDYMDILSSHEGNICRHIIKNENIPSVTCGAIIFCPDDKKIYIKKGHPCKHPWMEYII